MSSEFCDVVPLTIEYLVQSENQENFAKILLLGELIATVQINRLGTSLHATDGRKWFLSQRVDGELRPFSMVAEKIEGALKTVTLKIRDHLFFHSGNMYMYSNVPEGLIHHHAKNGPKFISRLVNFPFSDPSEVDPETRHRLRRVRGVPVGEINGLGHSGHSVKIERELEDIGLEISASAFLLYTTRTIAPLHI